MPPGRPRGRPPAGAARAAPAAGAPPFQLPVGIVLPRRRAGHGRPPVGGGAGRGAAARPAGHAGARRGGGDAHSRRQQARGCATEEGTRSLVAACLVWMPPVSAPTTSPRVREPPVQRLLAALGVLWAAVRRGCAGRRHQARRWDRWSCVAALWPRQAPTDAWARTRALPKRRCTPCRPVRSGLRRGHRCARRWHRRHHRGDDGCVCACVRLRLLRESAAEVASEKQPAARQPRLPGSLHNGAHIAAGCLALPAARQGG